MSNQEQDRGNEETVSMDSDELGEVSNLGNYGANPGVPAAPDSDSLTGASGLGSGDDMQEGMGGGSSSASGGMTGGGGTSGMSGRTMGPSNAAAAAGNISGVGDIGDTGGAAPV